MNLVWLADHDASDYFALGGVIFTLVGALIWVVKRIANDAEGREKRADERDGEWLASIRRLNDRQIKVQEETNEVHLKQIVATEAQTRNIGELRTDFRELKVELKDFVNTARRQRGD